VFGLSHRNSGAGELEVGRVAVQVPAGWGKRDSIPGDPVQSLTLVPSDGSRLRIRVTQNTVLTEPTLEQLAVAIGRLLAVDPVGHDLTVAPKPATVGGRQVVMYEERIDDDQLVRHQVLVEHGTQVSVDCQYLAGEWDAVSDPCGRVTSSVEVGP
jgi:type VII secretion-associated protein (TIGR03931 family)